MNIKQAAPIAAAAAPAIALAPPLLIIGGIALFCVWLLSDDKKPESAPVTVPPSNPPSENLVNSSQNAAEIRDIPPVSVHEFTVAPVTVPGTAATVRAGLQPG